MIELTAAQARRVAVRSQLLDGSASGIRGSLRQLSLLQLDPTARVVPSHLLVLWSRLGRFDRTELDRLLWHDRALFEWNAFLYPIEDLPAYRSRMRRFPIGDGVWPRRARAWMRANASFRRYILRELESRGPLLSRDLEDRARVPWPSSGWTGDRNLSEMLEFMLARGDLAVVGRRTGQRLWDLATRWYPPGETLPAREADAFLAERRLRSLGICRRGPGLPARVEGVPGTWRIHPDALALGGKPVPQRTALLSPFDRLIHDRNRTEALFRFHYRMEIYVPRAQRRYGYFVLPILRGDRLVGRIDPEYDRRSRVLRVNAVHWEPHAREVPLERPLLNLARFLGAERVEPLPQAVR